MIETEMTIGKAHVRIWSDSYAGEDAAEIERRKKAAQAVAERIFRGCEHGS